MPWQRSRRRRRGEPASVRIDQAVPTWAPKVATCSRSSRHRWRSTSRTPAAGGSSRDTVAWLVPGGPDLGPDRAPGGLLRAAGPGEGLRVVVGAASSHRFDIGGNPHADLAASAWTCFASCGRAIASAPSTLPTRGRQGTWAWLRTPATRRCRPGPATRPSASTRAGDYRGTHRRLGRLVRRGRLRQVRHERRRSPSGSCCASSTSSEDAPARAAIDGTVRRRVWLAAGLDAADAGPGWGSAGGDGVPQGARHQSGRRCRGCRTRTRRPASCTARRRRRRWHLAAVAAQAWRVLAPDDPTFGGACSEWPGPPPTQRGEHPDLDGAGRRTPRCGGGAYPDDDPADDAYWAAAELWLATGDEQTYLRRRGDRAGHTAESRFRAEGFDFDARGRGRRAWTSLCTATTSAEQRLGARGVGGREAERLLELQSRTALGTAVRARREGWAWGSNGRHAQQPGRAGGRPRADRPSRGA